MKTLILMRHAKSSWKQENQPDVERPLKKKGIKCAKRMGELLRAKKHVPDLILSSTAVRARMTTELVIEAMKYKNKVEYLEKLYLAEAGEYLEIFRTLPDEVKEVLVIGHNPAIEVLLQTLSHEIEALPTAAAAQINLPIEHWNELNNEVVGQLKHFWKPQETD
jgi:phosphohistidine phosphatase